MADPLPTIEVPIAAGQVARPFHRPGWIYEEKYDGGRMVAYKDGTVVRLVSRTGEATVGASASWPPPSGCCPR